MQATGQPDSVGRRLHSVDLAPGGNVDKPPTSQDVGALVARIDELEHKVEHLEHDRGVSAAGPTAGAETPVSRRRLIGMAGAATVGAMGATVLAASPSGAADPNDVVLGVDSQAGGAATTGITSTAVSTIRGVNTGTGTGVFGSAASGSGVAGFTNSGNALEAAAPFTSSGAHLRLTPATGAGAPASGAHTLGQFWMDSNGVLFQCVEAATPGTWVRQAPLVTLASPVRVYDSRSGQPNQAPNTQGSLTFTSAPPSSAFRDVACNKNASSGTTVVPAGARTLLMNLAIVSISGVGALNAYATGTTQPATANINWSAGGQVLSNAVTSACNTSQHVNFAIVASSGAATHLIVDVIGYYL